MSFEKVIKKLERIVDPGDLLINEEDLLCYTYDANVRGILPWAVVFPRSTEQVREILLLANEFPFFVFPRGAGTGMTGGSVPTAGGVVLCMTKMKAIKEISPEDGIAIVEAGVLNGELQQEAKKHNLFFPPDPSSYLYSTIGGNVAENAGGARALRYGVTRDYVLGLEVVTGKGEILRTGRRTWKGVVGYDLTGLFVGSEGTLGVITEVTVKLLPIPPEWGTLVGFFPSLSEAFQAVWSLFSKGIMPSSLEFMDQFSLKCAEKFLQAEFPPSEALLILELEGIGIGLGEFLKRIKEILLRSGAREVEEALSFEESQRIWRIRRCLSQAAYALGPVKVNEDIVVPRSKIAEAVRGAHQIAEKYGINVLCFGHIGDGNIHVNFMIGPSEEERAKVHKAVEELFDLTLSLGGTLSGEHGVGITKLPYIGKELAKEVIMVMKDIKKIFDPKGILNPNKAFLP